MHLLTLLLLHLSLTTALPQPQRDPCGPKTQSPSDPADSCTTTPPLVTEPAAFGVFPTTNQNNQNKSSNNNEANNTDNEAKPDNNITHPACTLAFNNLCDTIAGPPHVRAEQWYFETATKGQEGCQVGFWPPGDEGAVEGLVEGQCGRVFGAVVEGVGVGGGEGASGVKEGGGREGASVNLVRGPVGVEGMWIGEGGEGEVFTGEAVNSGYPSYIVTTYGSAIPAGKCLDPEGRFCDCDGEDGAKCAPPPACRYQNGNLCECGDDGVTCAIEDGGSAGDVSCLDEDGSGTLVPCPE